MQFLYPNFLWALLALAIPIIIHLFYFRRFRKVYFTNVKFLKEIKEETSTKNRIKNLLVLLSRMLALAFLVFAFAKPFIPVNEDIKQGNSAISIFIDNSFSMTAGNSGTPLLVRAKGKATEIVSAYSEEDQFQILSNDFEGRHQRFLQKEDAISFIEEIEQSPSIRPISNIVDRQKQLLEKSNYNKISYIISDFQEEIVDQISLPDSSIEVNLIPLQALQETNVSIDTAWFDAIVPMIDQSNKLIIRVTNYSDQPQDNVKLSIFKDGEEKPISVLNIDPLSSVLDTFELPIFKTGIHKAELKISDFPVQFDDNYYISFNVKEEIKVLAINQSAGNKFVTSLFSGLNYFKLTNKKVNQLDYQSFQDYELIILNDLSSFTSGIVEELKKYVSEGGKVLIFPSKNADLSSYNKLCNDLKINTVTKVSEEERQVSSINVNEFIFDNVFERIDKNIKLPKTSISLDRTNYAGKAEERLLMYNNGSPYLTKSVLDEGIIYFCSSPLNKDVNDLVLNPEIFVPMIYKMSLAKVQSEKLSYVIGEDDMVELPKSSLSKADNEVVKVYGVNEFIPSQVQIGNNLMLNVNDQISKSDYYDFKSGAELLKTAAFNYSRKESDMALIKPDDLKSYITGTDVNIFDKQALANVGESISDKDRGTSFWKWCLILALLFLAIESLLLRYWKN